MGADYGMQNGVRPHGGQLCFFQKQEGKIMIRKSEHIDMYVNILLTHTHIYVNIYTHINIHINTYRY